ncbi:DUF1232 domain-containing protein [Clostridium sp. D2Q-14]|uniref:YkvA family protein n=1 Tax=Anaeromonas gelatinilytica TaxID=2683194 RepID=UPI00193C6BAD|nr:DUF1232 domain-containing protein [Anaeromonas gelatinilytica]MBS4536660.1 DUF1232 domain-containing protein [Anaeromonas gelatinilytica]
MKSKIKNTINSDKKKALKYIKNREKGKKLINDAIKKSKKDSRRIKGFSDDLKTLIDMFKSFISGEYKSISKKTIITIVAGLLYFVNPLDVVPDFILYAGYIDDALVFSFIIKSIKNEIEEFKNWQNINN